MCEKDIDVTRPMCELLPDMKNIFKSGWNQTETLESYKNSDQAALVLKSTSADGKWIAEFHKVETQGEWFAITKAGEIVASGSKSTVNSVLNKKGYKHDSMVSHGRWIKA